MGTIAFIQGGTITVAPNDIHAALAFAQLTLAAAEIDRYNKEYKDAAREMRKGLSLQEEVSDYYHEFYIEHQMPRLLDAINYAYAIDVPVLDPDKLFREIKAYATGLVSCDENLPDALMEGGCMDALHGCDNRFDIQQAKAFASMYHNQAVGIKVDTIAKTQRKQAAIMAAIDRGETESQAVYAEVNNHLSVYQALGDIAAGGLNGALGNAGYAVGQLINKYRKK